MPLPPLVAPAADLSPAEVARYSRHLVLAGFGEAGQKRLKNARVLVIGAGGLGSPILLYLAAAGVGTLGIVDFDTVEESNLQRQIIHGAADVGRSKVRSSRDAVAALNPLVTVEMHDLRLAPDNAVELFSRYDLIIDGTDNFATRYLINDAAVLAGKPYVWGAVQGFEGQVSVFWEHAPDGPDGRRRGLNYRDLHPEAPPEPVPSCAEGGVLGLTCAAVAAAMGTEAVKLITGIGESLLGRLLIHDALAMSQHTIGLRKDPEAPPITALADYPGIRATDGEAVTPGQLRDLLDAGEQVILIDVREPGEWAAGHIDGAVLVPLSDIGSGAGLSGLPRDRIPVLYCRTGTRSAAALALLRGAGFADAVHLRGGIVAWANQFDPDMGVH